MPKRCIICGQEAKFCIRHTNDYYCEECARENFSDLQLLEKIEGKAKKLKKYLEEIDQLESKKAPQEVEELKKE